MSDNTQSHQGEENGSAPAGGRTVSRREFLKRAGLAGAVIGVSGGLAGLVAGCGSAATTTTTTAAPATTSTTAAQTTTSAAATTTSVSTQAELARELKIGFASPQTGVLAFFGAPDKYCSDRAKEAIGDGIVCADGKKHPITIVLRDTQSDTNRAAQVAGDLIDLEMADPRQVARAAEKLAAIAEPPRHGLPGVEVEANHVRGRAQRAGRAVPGLLRDLEHDAITLEAIEVHRPTLDDVFLTLTGRTLRDAEASTKGDVAEDDARAVPTPTPLPGGEVDAGSATPTASLTGADR